MATVTSPHISYDAVGDGEPAVLFLPGWCGDRDAFSGLLPLVARNRRAIALDWRGHGESGMPEGDFGVEDLVDDAMRVITGLRLHRVVPVGLSHAGWVVIELRRRLGHERVPGVAFLDWMVLGPPPGFTDACAGLQDPDAWADVRGTLFDMWTTGVDAAGVHDYVAGMARYGHDMWARAGREIASQFVRHDAPLDELARVTPAPPTLHLYAQPRDEAFLEAQRAFSREHPWFDVQRLDARSHFPMFEVPHEIADALEDFVAQVAGRS